jgi:hypothetical protein
MHLARLSKPVNGFYNVRSRFGKTARDRFRAIRRWNAAAARVQRCNTWLAIEHESAFA